MISPLGCNLENKLIRNETNQQLQPSDYLKLMSFVVCLYIYFCIEEDAKPIPPVINKCVYHEAETYQSTLSNLAHMGAFFFLFSSGKNKQKKANMNLLFRSFLFLLLSGSGSGRNLLWGRKVENLLVFIKHKLKRESFSVSRRLLNQSEITLLDQVQVLCLSLNISL